MNLFVSEIFHGIEGETTRSGLPALFIRLAGCNLNCKYCDTEESKSGGKEVSIDLILEKIKRYHYINHITVTGGEPLMQNNCINLLEKLIGSNFDTQIETNGTFDCSTIPKGVRKIVDIKTPSSGESDSFFYKNISYTGKGDEWKFVIANIEDYNFSNDFILSHLSDTEAVINFSPVFDTMKASKLGELIISDKLPVRLNLQLHKIVWSEKNECKYEIVLDNN